MVSKRSVSTSPKPTRSKTASTVQAALTLCTTAFSGTGKLRPDWDAARLGDESPLAAPYFLGRFTRLPVTPSHLSPTPAERGTHLAQALFEIAQTLPQEKDRDALAAYYFQRSSQLNALGVAMQLDYKSEQSLFGPNGRLTQAIERFTEALFTQLEPPLRPESLQARALVGREQSQTDILAALRNGKTVSIIGEAGVGKTALALAVAESWGAENVMRYTIRPGLTHHLGSFLFTLAYFLRLQGRTALWAQIVTDDGVIRNISKLQGLLRFDLESLPANQYLLWVDEADLLRIDQPENAALRQQLETLRNQIPMLWTGQAPFPLENAPESTLHLNGISAADLHEWLRQTDVACSPAEAAQLHMLTGGNLARLEFWRALYEPGTNWETALNLTRNSGTQALFEQLWRKRLKADEHSLLQYLSVFRAPAPDDIFPATLLKPLLTRHLIVEADTGTVTLRADVRAWLLSITPTAEQVRCHLLAANVWQQRGDFTAAAYHYIEGGEPALAIGSWYAQRKLEKSKGQAPTALALFRGLLPESLHPTDRSLWALLISELLADAGETIEAEESLNHFALPAAHGASIFKEQMKAQYLFQRGQYPQALEKYRLALETLSEWTAKRAAYLYQRRGYIWAVLQRQPQPARIEASLANASIEKLWGQIAEAENNLPEARTHFQQGLTFAESGGDLSMCADLHDDIGRTAWQTGDFSLAYQHIEKAITLAKKMGDRRRLVGFETNLSATYIMDEHYAEARDLLCKTIETARMINSAEYVALTANNLGEAYYYLGQLDEAERCVLISLGAEDELSRALALTLLGHVYRTRQQYAKAENFYNEAIQAAEAFNMQFELGYAWLGLGENHDAAGNPSQAHAALEQALQFFTLLNLSGEIKKTQKLLAHYQT